SHTGVNEGFQGIFLGLLRGGRGVVVMTNSDNGLRLANEIVNSVAMAYDWPVLRPVLKTALALEPAALSAYAGSYHTQFGSTDVAFDIRADGSELAMQFSADGFEERAYAETPTRFFTLDGKVLVFSRDTAGKVVSVAVNGFTFARRQSTKSQIPSQH
ncbi:MAG: hypothetical protein ABWY12_02010, partial [Burkholderiales bacterium]